MDMGAHHNGQRQVLRGPALPPSGEEPGTDLLRLSTHADGRGAVVVELNGEIDLTTAPKFVAALTMLQIPPRTPGLVVFLDLSGLDFCDVVGLNAMVRSARVLAERGARLALAAPRKPLAKMLKITGLDEFFEVFPSLAAAQISTTPHPVRRGVA